MSKKIFITPALLTGGLNPGEDEHEQMVDTQGSGGQVTSTGSMSAASEDGDLLQGFKN